MVCGAITYSHVIYLSLYKFIKSVNLFDIESINIAKKGGLTNMPPEKFLVYLLTNQ